MLLNSQTKVILKNRSTLAPTSIASLKYFEVEKKLLDSDAEDLAVDGMRLTQDIQLKLILDIFYKLSTSFEIIFQKNLGQVLGQKIKKGQQNELYQFFIKIFNHCWKHFYKLIKNLLLLVSDESRYQTLLNIIQIQTNLAGTIGNSQACQAFINAICNGSQEVSAIQEMNARTIQTGKMILNIAHCLGSNAGFYSLSLSLPWLLPRQASSLLLLSSRKVGNGRRFFWKGAHSPAASRQLVL